MKKRYLLTPGPSPVPSRIREVLSREIVHHRTNEFKDILKNVHNGLKSIFCTANPVVIFSSSGTGAMEAAVANLCSSGDKVITVSGGKFGKRWTEIARAYGLDAIELSVEWGSAPSGDEIADLLEKNKGIKAVFTTLCETSTATVYDIEAVAKVVKDTPAVLVVDAISGLGQDKLLTDDWGVDVVVSGSQKGFMLPPGLSFISISGKAKDKLKTSDLPKYYYDLNKALKSYEKNDTPFTSSVSLIRGLEEAINIIMEEGLEERWRRFEKLSLAVREAAKEMGLKVLSRRPSASVTAILTPENIASSKLAGRLRKEYGLSIAGGQEHLKDKIIRIAHMGWIDVEDLIVGFSFLEKGLRSMGYDVKPGASLGKLQEVYYG